jgi:SAM-dependent methyltransferase
MPKTEKTSAESHIYELKKIYNWLGYSGLYSYCYDDYEGDVRMYLTYAYRHRGPILDLMSGTGRILVPLAKAGFNVTGVDYSEEMSKVCLKRIKENEETRTRSRIIVSDVRTFSIPNIQFSFALIAMASFGHLLTQENKIATLRRVREHIRDDGVLIIDEINADPLSLISTETAEENKETRMMVLNKLAKYTARTPVEENIEMLRESGFQGIEVYGDYGEATAPTGLGLSYNFANPPINDRQIMVATPRVASHRRDYPFHNNVRL